MRNALILTGVWLGILVTAYAVVYWDQGIDRPLPISILEQQVQTVDPEYIHPDGLFSASSPVGWQMESDGGMVTMNDPNENIQVSIMATDTGELDELIDDAFAWLELGEDFSRSASVALPLGEWDGSDVSVTYRSETADDVVSLQAQRPQEWSIVLVARGPERSLEAFSENLEWIWLQLAVPADTLKLL